MKYRHFGSRKWAAAVIGIGCVMVVFVGSLGCVLVVPSEKAAEVVALANMTVVFLGAITGSLVTGQSFVDWRHGSQSQFEAVTKRLEVESNQELVPRVVASKHYDDKTVS